jgi:hypothetical protein
MAITDRPIRVTVVARWRLRAPVRWLPRGGGARRPPGNRGPSANGPYQIPGGSAPVAEIPANLPGDTQADVDPDLEPTATSDHAPAAVAGPFATARHPPQGDPPR